VIGFPRQPDAILAADVAGYSRLMGLDEALCSEMSYGVISQRGGFAQKGPFVSAHLTKIPVRSLKKNKNRSRKKIRCPQAVRNHAAFQQAD
jgi:hypothetical protein